MNRHTAQHLHSALAHLLYGWRLRFLGAGEDGFQFFDHLLGLIAGRLSQVFMVT